MDGSTVGTVPLARLFALAFNDLIEDLHRRLEEAGWRDVRRQYGFVLLALRERSATATELADLLRVSKQATSKLLDGMETAGYVVRRVAGNDGRRKEVSLAPAGHRLLAAVESIYVELEAEWAELIGDEQVERLRASLATVVRHRHDGRLPPVSAP